MKNKIKRNPRNIPREQTRHRTGNVDDHPQKYYHNVGKKYTQGNFRVVDEIYKYGKISNGNIYWRDIPDDATVYTRGNLYYVDGKMVFWHGTEAREAQGELKRRAMRGKKGDYRADNWWKYPVKGKISFWRLKILPSRADAGSGYVAVNEVEEGAPSRYRGKYQVEINTSHHLENKYFDNWFDADDFAINWMKKNPYG